MNNDTIALLKECNSGIKMGESAIKRVLPKVTSDKLRHALEVCNNTHAQLGDRTHGMLLEGGADTKPAHAIANAMSNAKISVSLFMNESDGTVASLMTDGVNMGIKSLSKYLNKYKDADSRSKAIAKELIASEEYLGVNMREFL
jgi:hypothetical protein